MDKKRSILNVSVSIFSSVILYAAAFFVRRLLIRYIGNEVNGLNSLYTSIIGLLSVAELGVGSAIAFSMYKPIVQGKKSSVAALYSLFRKLYRIIGAVIFFAGLAVMPFLPRFISDYEAVNVNVYATFFLMLISIVLSYFYGAKTSLIEAYKENYITTSILTVSKLVRYGLQIAAILIWKSFSVFLFCQILETLLIWGMTEKAVRRKYGDIIATQAKLDNETKREIVRNVKAMFMHKVGTIVVNSIDSVIISSFIGVVLLGKYSNYAMIAGMMMNILALFFSPLTSVVGHLCAEGDRDRTKGYYDFFHSLNYVLGFVFFLGYYAVIDHAVSLLFGPDLRLSRAISFIITLNQFTQYMRKATLLFRDASGAFYYDRWKPIAEGACNLALSLIFVRVFPEDFKAAGVITATVLTTLLICDIVDPYVLFTHVFNKKPWKFYIRNYAYIAVFTVSLLLMTWLSQTRDDGLSVLLTNCLLSFGVSLAALCLVFMFDGTFRKNVRIMGYNLMAWTRKHITQFTGRT